jgi:hypothetical protein
MANIKISDLTAAAAASGTQEFEVNDSLTSKKVTGAQVLAYIKANTTPADIGALATGAIGSTVQAYDAQLSTLADASVNRAAFLASEQTFGFRNRIINGNMAIDQRYVGASASLTSAQTYFLDRWFAVEDTDGTMTIQQSSTAPAGFSNSALLTTGTADASLGATQICYVGQKIEGFNFADLAWGTASAQTVTLSFWVRSSLTGTFGGALSNNAFNRSYPFTYTISAANTFEYKTVTIAGDTTGTWVGATNGVGLQLFFGLGVGSTYSGTAGAWAGSGYISATGATSVIGTAGATLYLTGVQLEAGSVASPFERRDYGRELMMCQRYYYRVKPEVTGIPFCVAYNDSTTESRGTVPFPVTMRTRPTALEQSGTAADYYINAASGAGNCTSVPSHYPSSVYAATFVFTKTSLTAGQGALLMTSSGSGANAYLAWSAEL